MNFGSESDLNVFVTETHFNEMSPLKVPLIK